MSTISKSVIVQIPVNIEKFSAQLFTSAVDLLANLQFKNDSVALNEANAIRKYTSVEFNVDP